MDLRKTDQEYCWVPIPTVAGGLTNWQLRFVPASTPTAAGVLVTAEYVTDPTTLANAQIATGQACRVMVAGALFSSPVGTVLSASQVVRLRCTDPGGEGFERDAGLINII